jgi:hypothetical protein
VRPKFWLAGSGKPCFRWVLNTYSFRSPLVKDWLTHHNLRPERQLAPQNRSGGHIFERVSVAPRLRTAR